MTKELDELNETVNAKLADLDTPGAVIEMDPEEAELAGAFIEDAITLEDALEAANGGSEGVL